MCSHFNLSSGYLKSFTYAQKNLCSKISTYAQITFYTYAQSFVGGFVVTVAGIVVVVPEIISCQSGKQYNSSFGIAYSEYVHCIKVLCHKIP